MTKQPERLLEQMYKNNIEDKSSTIFNYVGLTNRKDLIDNLNNITPKALKLVFYCLSTMQKRPYADPDAMWMQMLVTFDWSVLNIGNKSYRARIIRELKDIDFMTKYEGNSYLINLHYINPYSKLQHETIVKRLQMNKFKR